LHVFENADPASWNQHAKRLNGTFTHSYEYSLFNTEIYGTKPLYFKCKDENDEYHAIAIGRLGGKQMGGFSFFKTLTFGSLPACKDDDTRNKMIRLLHDYANKNSIMELSINSFSTPYDMEVVKELGFTVKKRWEFLLPLNLSEEKLWKNISPKKRNKIRKAEKKGIQVKERASLSDMMELKKLEVMTHNRKNANGIPYPSINESYFISLYNKLVKAGTGKLYLAYLNDKDCIAASFFGVFNKMAYYMLSSASNEGLNQAAPDAILWRVLKDCIYNKFKMFNFGGISESVLFGEPLEKAGLYMFKKSYFSETVPCYNSKIVLRPFIKRLHSTLKNIR